MSTEFRNPFQNAKIVSVDTDPMTYHRTGKDIPRGAAEFIMSRSELVAFRSCPQKWLLGAKDEDDSTDSTEFGDLVDCIVLSNDRFDERFAICPETYKDAKTGEEKSWTFSANVCKAWRAEAEKAGQKPVKHDVFQEATAAANRLFNDPITAEFLDCCDKQVMVMAEYLDHETKIVVPVKICLDLVPDKRHRLYGRCLADLKTARSAQERAWQNAIVEHNYMVQSSCYQDIYVAATGEERNTFLHLVVENVAPFEPCRSFLTQEFMEIGRMNYLQALQQYCICLKTGIWPGYNTELNSWPTLPGWKITEPPQWLLKNF